MSLLGRKITGYQDTSQVSPEEFLHRVDEILAFPMVRDLRFSAYTPYFNDGEPCVWRFGYSTSVLIEGINDDGEPETGLHRHVYCESSYFTGRLWIRKPYPQSGWETIPATTVNHDLAVFLKDFHDDGPSFERVIRSNFGEHVEVTATFDGFEVEFYDHE